jgi:hypothetical protein
VTKIIRFLFEFVGLLVVAGIVFGVLFEAARHDSSSAAVVLFVMFTIGLVQAMKFGGRLLLSELDDAGESSRAKVKRTADHGTDDARLSLLVTLMTPDERDELKTRLVDELDVDVDALPLAKLLANQHNDLHHY